LIVTIFFRIGERAHYQNGIQPKVLQELGGDGMQDWSAQSIGAAGFKDQAFVQQTLQQAVSVHTANRFDNCSGGPYGNLYRSGGL
jgi:hypothetical protein